MQPFPIFGCIDLHGKHDRRTFVEMNSRLSLFWAKPLLSRVACSKNERENQSNKEVTTDWPHMRQNTDRVTVIHVTRSFRNEAIWFDAQIMFHRSRRTESNRSIEHPAVTNACDGLYTALLLIADIAKRAPQANDGLGQEILAYVSTSPHGGNQFVLSDGTLAVLDEINQAIESTGRDKERLAISAQLSGNRVEAKIAELVNLGFHAVNHRPEGLAISAMQDTGSAWVLNIQNATLERKLAS